jgi:hypothetical protein
MEKGLNDSGSPFKIIATNNPSLKTSPALRSAVIEVSARMT